MSRLIAFLMGLFLGLFFGQRITTRPQATAGVVPARPWQAAPPPTPRLSPDPLTEIDGIGPAFEQALNALGIRTFADLARQKADELAARLPARVSADRIRRDRWIEQAQQKVDDQA
ncbi:MAG: hypothetical protein K8J31_02810 [Anaerolineae bacterium]|nr:hypothetical protein [Anaerolineae bacterium]